MIKMNKFKKYKTARRGFSLIEVLVTVFILAIGLVAVSTLMADNIKSSENAKNQIIASQLAQEGVELVRNMKDNGLLDPSYSDSSACTPASKCINLRIDKDDTIFNTNNTLDKQLYLNGNFFYTHAAGTPTKFYRRIDLTVAGAKATTNRVITATSYVTWNNMGFTVAAGIVDVSGNITNCNIGNKCVSVVSVMPDLN